MDPSVLRFSPFMYSHSHCKYLRLQTAESSYRLSCPAASPAWNIYRRQAWTSKNLKARAKSTSSGSQQVRSSNDTFLSEGPTCDIGKKSRESENGMDPGSPAGNGGIKLNGTSSNAISPAGVKALISANSVHSTEAVEQHIKPHINGEAWKNLGEFNQASSVEDKKRGLGIVEFLKGKNIFITGATGFLAKVLVEKILRVQPNVGQLYLLIKADDHQAAITRLKNDIMNASLFSILKRRHGNSYEDFMTRKLIPVVGDLTLDNLGLHKNAIHTLSSKVDIIVNSAASTTFDERYDHALNLNTKGPQRILEFSKRCPHLQLLMHVSTAFVNGQRRGLVREQPFEMGHSIAKEMYGEHVVPKLKVEKELKLVQEKIHDVITECSTNMGTSVLEDAIDTRDPNRFKDKLLTQAMKELGLERAKLFGWQDTYVFTKAMGEMLLESMREELPVVIVRPSVVESSFKEPFAGWMEGNRMMDPIILSYGKGQLTGFLVDPTGVLDVVPVDMVANAMLAAMAKHACKPGLDVYQIASSVVNPLIFCELSRISHEHFTEHPYIDTVGVPVKPGRMHLYEDMESFMASISNEDLEESDVEGHTRQRQLILKAKEQAAYLANLYKPYTFYEGRFDNTNTKQLYDQLSSEERDTFTFDVSVIDWEDYIKRIHIPGLRMHVLKGRGSNPEL